MNSTILYFVSIGEYANPIVGYTVEETKHIHNKLLALLCNPGHIGDMYQATSTNDITFWVIHNTVDRLWHFKRLGNLNNYDETWDPYHKCYGHNPRNYQPFRKTLFSIGTPDTDAAQRRRLGDGDGVSGIAAPAFDRFASENTAMPYYTNMELYDNLHPASSSLQYIYDDFKWEHCSKLGYKFSNAW